MSCMTRFEQHCNKRGEDDCWEWGGPRTRHGYGMLHCGGRRSMAHRFSWMIENGPIEDGIVVMHKCDNPPCVNPRHLAVGTHADNMRDMVAKGRHGAGGQHGIKHHAARFTEADVIAIRTSAKPHAELGRQYGVTPQTIAYVRHKGWASVELAPVPYERGQSGLKGASNPTSLLDDQKVREIRASTDKPKILAAKYGVTTDCIRHVIRRKSWKHVE